MKTDVESGSRHPVRLTNSASCKLSNLLEIWLLFCNADNNKPIFDFRADDTSCSVETGAVCCSSTLLSLLTPYPLHFKLTFDLPVKYARSCICFISCKHFYQYFCCRCAHFLGV